MKLDKAFEVAKELAQVFYTVTVEKEKEEWAIKVQKTYFYQKDMEKLQEFSTKYGLGYSIEHDIISIWEDDGL